MNIQKNDTFSKFYIKPNKVYFRNLILQVLAIFDEYVEILVILLLEL